MNSELLLQHVRDGSNSLHTAFSFLSTNPPTHVFSFASPWCKNDSWQPLDQSSIKVINMTFNSSRINFIFYRDFGQNESRAVFKQETDANSEKNHEEFSAIEFYDTFH